MYWIFTYIYYKCTWIFQRVRVMDDKGCPYTIQTGSKQNPLEDAGTFTYYKYKCIINVNVNISYISSLSWVPFHALGSHHFPRPPNPELWLTIALPRWVLCHGWSTCCLTLGTTEAKGRFEQWQKSDPVLLFRGFVGDEMLASYIRIKISHHKDPYKPSSKEEEEEAEIGLVAKAGGVRLSMSGILMSWVACGYRMLAQFEAKKWSCIPLFLVYNLAWTA